MADVSVQYKYDDLIERSFKAYAKLREVKQKRPSSVTNRLMLLTSQSNVSKGTF